MSWALRFIGVGNAQATALGSSCAVLERDGAPVLMIDCGEAALDGYLARYGEPPRAIFITHTHYDHIGGLERVFFQTWFDDARRGEVRMFAAAPLVPLLQGRLADYPGVLAEGGVNYWDAFRLVPHTRGFWHAGQWFDVFPTRHHAPGSSYGIALSGSFVYTGDTRPIPETVAHHAQFGELIAHDCALVGNPSHTGVDDLLREYPHDLRARMVVYHYASHDDGLALAAHGLRVATQGEAFPLAAPRAPESP